MLGHIDQFQDYQLDVQAMLGLAKTLDLPRPWYLMSHSMGGCIGLRALHQGLPVQAAAFSAPMWGLGISPQLRPMAWAWSFASRYIGMDRHYAPGTKPESYVLVAPFAGNSLTTDEDQWNYMAAQVDAIPELQLGGPSLRWLYEALLETRRLRAMTPPDMPVVTYLGGDEDVVDPGPVHRVMAHWPGGDMQVVAGAQHEFLMERPPLQTAFLDAVDRLFTENSGK